MGGLGRFASSGHGVVIGILTSAKDWKVEAMLTICSDVGTSEIRGVIAAKMTCWRKLGSFRVSGGKAI
jgi:hypothetical protein